MGTPNMTRLALWIARTPFARLGLVLALRFTPSLFPGRIHHLDKTLIAFDHPAPQYPVHILIIPRAGLRGLRESSLKDGNILSAVLRLANQLAVECGCASTGWRLVANGGAYQEVPVLHFHLLSGVVGK